MENLELEFVIEFSLLNYNLRFNEDENEFYVKKGDDWRLKKFTKNKEGYLKSGFSFEKSKQTKIYKHRLVFFAYNQEFDIFRRSTTENMIDHIDGNPSNNSLENLRLVSCQQNHFNQKRAKGYYWNKHAKKWLSKIRINRKSKHLGSFENEEEAREAYLKAKPLYHLFT